MTKPTATEQPTLPAWNQFIQDTLGRPSAQQIATFVQPPEGNQDPLIGLIDQLWEMNPFSKLLPANPGETTRAFQQLWLDAIRNPARAMNTYSTLLQQYTQLMSDTALTFLGQSQETTPIATPEKGDKRFSAPAWDRNPVFNALKQGYLLTATTLLKNAAEVEGLDEKQRHKMVFYLRQFVDAISPTNFALTNPQAIQEALDSGGQSLVNGMQNFLKDLSAGQLTMTDPNAFKPGRNLALTPGQVVHRNKLIELIQYAPTTETVHSIPLLLVPPWINKYYILDMQPKNSLIRYLVEQGFTVFIISWKNPDASMEDTTFEDYLDLGLLTAINAVKEISHSQQVNTIGYCIGGTLLAMTLAYLSAKKDPSVNVTTFFVTLLDFEKVGDTSVFIDEPQLEYMEEQMMERGYLDSSQMAKMFNMLRANDLIWSNVVNNYLLGKEPPAFDLLYWNADGTRMTRAAHSFYLRNTYLQNNLIKPNKIVLKGVPIDLGRIRQDIYAVGAEQDHIVPWQSAWRISQVTGGKVRFVLGGSGHIAGVINPPSKGRGYWTNDKPVGSATEWFASSTRHEGSWWSDWIEWLIPHAGEKVAPPAMGSAKHPPIAPAPGSYVLEK